MTLDDDGKRRRQGEPWIRDEYIVALDLYFDERAVERTQRDKEVQRLAEKIGRSAGSVSARLGNYRHLDPESDAGMERVSSAAREIWEEYSGNEAELEREATRALERLQLRTGQPTETDSAPSGAVETGEREVTRETREGQRNFRKAVRERYGDQCLLCDVSKPGLLQAAHILNWGQYPEHRGDPSNGLLLCYNHHRAFDLHMFTITEELQLAIRPDTLFTDSSLVTTLTNRDGDSVDFNGTPPSAIVLEKHNQNHVPWYPDEG